MNSGRLMVLSITDGLKIDMDKLLSAQNKYKTELEQWQGGMVITGSYNQALIKIINKETVKYKQRNSIIMNAGVLRIGKINVKKLNRSLYKFLKKNIGTRSVDINGFMRKINKIIFPHGIHGEMITPAGEIYYKTHESGKYRNTRSLISLGGVSYYFIEPEHVAYAMQKLSELLLNEELFPVVKYIFFIYYLWNIHPFYDGNGAIARLIFSYLLIKSGLKPIEFDHNYFFIDHTTGFFYDKKKVNFENILSDFILNQSILNQGNQWGQTLIPLPVPRKISEIKLI